VQLALLRHPGFGLRSDEVVAEALLHYLAGQLNVSVKRGGKSRGKFRV
jgi:hypothetical protein